jgi:hypothetical protein
MSITDHPLHRSGQAALPHPAPTWGDDAQAPGWIGVTDACERKPSGDQGLHLMPRQVIALTASTQHQPPHTADRTAERTEGGAVPRDVKVARVIENYRPQVGANRWDVLVHSTYEFRFTSLGFGGNRFRIVWRGTANRTFPRLPAAVRNARKVAPRTAPELHQSRLLGMRFQSKARKPLAQLGQEPLSLDSRLEPSDKVIREASHDHIAARLLRFPSKVRPYLRGVVDRAGSPGASPWRCPEFRLPQISTASAPRSNPPRAGASIWRLNTPPARSRVNASPSPLRTPIHASGPMWLAGPSMYRTFIYNTLPV